MTLLTLDHCAIRTAQLDLTIDFYTGVLGLVDGDRPGFPFPGAWLYLGDKPVIHLIGVEDADATVDHSAGGTGAIDHIAFHGTGLAQMRARLAELGIAWRDLTVPDLGLQQVFLKDPNGITVEINYAADEALD